MCAQDFLELGITMREHWDGEGNKKRGGEDCLPRPFGVTRSILSASLESRQSGKSCQNVFFRSFQISCFRDRFFFCSSGVSFRVFSVPAF
jgi:hypothetical protein